MRNIALLIFFMTIMSCNRSPLVEKLASSEKLIQNNPEKALALLTDIDTSKFANDNERNYYGLLLSEARYKSGIDDTISGPISRVSEYYDRQGDDPMRARAHYQNALIEANDKKYAKSLISLLLAERSASNICDTLRLALIHRSMGDAFDHIQNPGAAVNYYRKSFDEFSLTGDTIYRLYALYDLARTYYNEGVNDTAIILGKQLLSFAEEANDNHNKTMALGLLADASLESGLYNDGISYISNIQDTRQLTIKNYNTLGLCYLYSGQPDKAEICEDSILARGDSTSWLTYQIAFSRKNYELAHDLQTIYYKRNNAIAEEFVKRSSEQDLFDYYKLLESNISLERTERTLKTILIISAILLFACVSIIMTYSLFLRQKRKNKLLIADNNQKDSYAETLKSKLFESSSAITKLQESVISQKEELLTLIKQKGVLSENIECLEKSLREKDSTYSELNDQLRRLNQEIITKQATIDSLKSGLADVVISRFEIIDNLSKAYYDVEDVPLGQKEFFEVYKKDILTKIRDDEAYIKKIENYINRHLDNLFKQFREDYTNLKETDFRLYLFLLLGFSGKSISLFMRIPVDRVYNRKAALIKKIKAAGEDKSGRYLCYILS